VTELQIIVNADIPSFLIAIGEVVESDDELSLDV